MGIIKGKYHKISLEYDLDLDNRKKIGHNFLLQKRVMCNKKLQRENFYMC